MPGVVERTCKLHPGEAGDFHRVVVDEVMRCSAKVVAFDSSLDGTDLYFLLRGYGRGEDRVRVRGPRN